VRILETALSSHSRPSFCNAGHSPTGPAYWILSGARQASRAADEVIEYGTRTSRYWYFSDVDLSTNVRFAPILLKKSFLADGQIFLGPLMRFARGDVRDHIVLHKNDHGPSYRP
jgi:hypothetical protein